MVVIEDVVRTRVAKWLCTHESVIFGVYCNSWNKRQNHAQVGEWKAHYNSTYIILFFTLYYEPMHDDEQMIFTHQLCVSL